MASHRAQFVALSGSDLNAVSVTFEPRSYTGFSRKLEPYYASPPKATGLFD